MDTSALQKETKMNSARRIEQIVKGIATSDGAGVRLTRVLTQNLQRRLDPFLMLDVFRSDEPTDYLAGFPDHPHRGFETVTYMLAGRMRHRDSAGHEGLLEGGDVQWMTAGRGVIHSEMPEQENGLMEGFQLWLNLPAGQKMTTPWYRDIPAALIPEFETQCASVRVIAGNSRGIKGAVTRDETEPLFLDILFEAAGDFSTSVPAAHNAFIYVYSGSVTVDGREVGENRMGIFANDPHADGISIRADKGARLILVSGKPLGEPIVQHGPFVMNTQEEIYQAIRDFREGLFASDAASSV